MKVLTLRRPDECSTCRTALDAGTRALWDPAQRQVRCLPCHKGRAALVDASQLLLAEATALLPEQLRTGGVSAQREYDRRSARREHKIPVTEPALPTSLGPA